MLAQRFVPSLILAFVALIATPIVLGLVSGILFLCLTAAGVQLTEDSIWLRLIGGASAYAPIAGAIITFTLGMLGRLPGTKAPPFGRKDFGSVEPPKIDPVRIEKREHRLLAHEASYRVLRKIGLAMGIFLLFIEKVLPLLQTFDGPVSENARTTEPGDSEFLIIVVVALLVLGVFAHAKVRHAESVRFHLARQRFGRCPKCGYDLEGNIDGSCPECGWRRAK